jgi:hypothetical protein
MLKPFYSRMGRLSVAAGLVSAHGFAAGANKQRSIPNREWKPEEIKETATEPRGKHLATLDDATFGAASPVAPKFISRSGPAAVDRRTQRACLLRLCQ